MAIEGKVAEILNERELVLNKGEIAGVKKDMIFGVFETKEVIDPDTGEILGPVDSVKIRAKVVDVQPKLSVCRTFETYQVNIGGSGIDWILYNGNVKVLSYENVGYNVNGVYPSDHHPIIVEFMIPEK